MLGRLNCIAVDESRSAREAFHWYLNNYHREEDTVLLLHVHQVPHLPAMGLLSGALAITGDYKNNVQKSVKSSKRVLSYFKKFCNRENVRYKVATEDDYHPPGHMICDSAKSNSANVIIVGQSHANMVGKLLHSKTSQYVLNHSSVPVIVVPPGQPTPQKCGPMRDNHAEGCAHLVTS